MARTKILNINGLPVTVTFKRVKHVRIKVTTPNADVEVSAPNRMKIADVTQSITQQLEWITDKRASILAKSWLTFTGEPGEIVSLWGELFTLTPVEFPASQPNKRITITVTDDNTIVMREPIHTTNEQRLKAIDRWQRGVLTEALEAMLETWIPIVGATPNEWRLKNMKTRWGTCNSVAKRLWFSTKLVTRFFEEVEYVVVHELVHLLVPNHGPEFKAEMDRCLPDWRERKKLMKHSVLENLKQQGKYTP